MIGSRCVSITTHLLRPTTISYWKRGYCEASKHVISNEINKKDPLVVLVGWLGATPRHMGRYQRYYEQIEKKEVIFHIPSLPSMLFQSISKRASKEMIHNLSTKYSDRPLLFHTFSGNGLNFYAHFIKQLCTTGSVDDTQKDQIKKNIVGCIIDSAPPDFSPEMFNKGFTGALLGILHKRKKDSKIPAAPVPKHTTPALPRYEHPIITPLLRPLFWLYFKFPVQRIYLTVRKALLQDQPNNIPQCFVYSKADELITPSQIEPFIKDMKNHGFTVESHVFESSPHCSHYLYYPERYMEITREFVKYCMKLDPNKQHS
eukprot:TRINITY_DN4855_c0_g1_i1.p1 TRINITY_DN4855_c0_g1~~TRINITY_DN4855_c0_g1_i1.p1  ORF type:complete len:316 (+),score=34.74 TRINITY_DN4855_c0_g1_i1:3-950(+)